jgi:hypothetical protein
MRKEIDVKDVFAVFGFFFGKKVEKERAQACLVKGARDELIAWAKPTAAAAVCEQNNAGGVLWDRKVAFQSH